MCDTIDPGYDSPYAKHLEREIHKIEKILGQLVLAHGEHKSIDEFVPAIEEWMGGDDWYWSLSDEDQKRLDAIKGWTYD
jgi:hypothetical protein